MDYISNIIIGKPLVDLGLLLGNYYTDESYKGVTVQETERYLPRLLVKYGFMSSNSEVRRNRKDLVKTLDKPDFLEIKIGKKKLWIVVGAESEEEYNKSIKKSRCNYENIKN